MTRISPRRTGTPRALVPLALSLVFLLASVPAAAQSGAPTVRELDRGRARLMLRAVRAQVERHYYDPAYGGLSLDSLTAVAEARIAAAGSLDEVFESVARVAQAFGNDHTYFVPPPRAGSIDYGWWGEMVGDTCFVTRVRPGSDAEAKGVRVGDAVLAVNLGAPTRGNFYAMRFHYEQLRLQPGLRLSLRSPDGTARTVDAMARVRQGRRVVDLTGGDGGQGIRDFLMEMEEDDDLRRAEMADLDGGVVYWKPKTFARGRIRDGVAAARRARGLVLDLRGNGGGDARALLDLVGALFTRDVTVATLRRRRGEEPFVARGRPEGSLDAAVTGPVVVLVDHGSGSAAEVFARTMQLTGRGVVVGDRTHGSVLRSRFEWHQTGAATTVPYATSVADADVVMPDGRRLEGVGVTPDHLVLPTGADLAESRDPALARAASLLGVTLTPEEAGRIRRRRIEDR